MIKTEGTVQLSISELDNLRGQIAKLQDDVLQKEKENKNLVDNQKKIRLEVCVAEQNYELQNTYNNRYGHMPKTYDKHVHLQEPEISYINLDEAYSMLKEKLDDDTIKELGRKDREINYLKREIETLKTDHEKSVSDITDYHIRSKEELRNDIKKLKDKIKELEGIEVDKTKDTIIADLQKQVSEYKEEIEKLKYKKGFWGSIFR